MERSNPFAKPKTRMLAAVRKALGKIPEMAMSVLSKRLINMKRRG
ncbi:hypothetical protein [Mesobacillus foraminis]